MSVSQIKEGISLLGNVPSQSQLHPLQTTSPSLLCYGEPQFNDPMTKGGGGVAGGGSNGSNVIDPTNNLINIRRPLRLEALNTTQSKKSRKKKNTTNGQS